MTQHARTPAERRYADRLSEIGAVRHDAREEPPPEPPRVRVRTRWYFAVAVVLAVLAVFVLPVPLSGIASFASLGAFITGGVRHVRGGDAEVVDRATRSGVIGG